MINYAKSKFTMLRERLLHYQANRCIAKGGVDIGAKLSDSEQQRKKKLVLFYSSRNNYEMLEKEVIPYLNNEGYSIVNVDDKSSDEQKERGRKICRKHNIAFLENTGRGLQCATKTVSDYLVEVNCEAEWLVHMTHDNFPLIDDFFSKLDKLVSNSDFSSFGCIGFNHLDLGKKTAKSFSSWKSGKNVIGMVGLARLAKIGDQKGYWYDPKTIHLDWSVWGQPFSVEVIPYMSFALNLQLFREHITVTDRLKLFFWGDDLCMQFLRKGIENICVPCFYTLNRQDLKAKHDIPTVSASGSKKGDDFHFEPYGDHFEYWSDVWGWNLKERESFSDVLSQYRGTLLESFYNHDIRNGPLKTYNNLVSDEVIS